MNTRNVLLIGRTGSGKSTLANVLMDENRFNVSTKSVSETKNIEEGVFEVNLDRSGNEKIRYRVIDTIGLGDTNMTPQGVLMRLAEMAGRVKREGLNQILFVTKGRFTKEEIEAYDLLSSIIFDKNVIKYTTIVRTGFEDFEDEDICEEDRESLKMENEDLAHIIRRVKVVYADNPPVKGRSAATNKLIREESRKRLLTYLATCDENYRPSNIDTLDERVHEYQTNEEKLHKKLEELEEIRKEERKKFLKEMEELKKQQTEELNKMKDKNEKDIRDAEARSKEELRQTKIDMENNHRRDMDNLRQANKDEIRDLKDTHRQEADRLREEGKRNLDAIREQNRLDRERDKELIDELKKKSDSSSEAIETGMASLKVDDSKHEERLLAEAKVRDKELEIQKFRAEKEEARLDELNKLDAQKKKQQNESEKRKQAQEEKARALAHEKNAAGFFETIGKGAFG